MFPAAFPEDAISTHRRCAAARRRSARPISSSSRNRGLHKGLYITLPGIEELITRPIMLYAFTLISSRLGRNNCAGGSQLGLGSALEITSPPNIVLPGKPHPLLCEISYLDLIVLPGKKYRPCEETLSSCPGTNIVPSGNEYRSLQEPISSFRGKVIVLSRK